MLGKILLSTQPLRLVLLRFPRWRNSFLISLIFGIPVMVVMAYFMATMSHCASTESSSSNETNTTSSGADSTSSSDMTMTSDECQSMIMIAPGLSLENLILFLLCTPCQVTISSLCSPFYCLLVLDDQMRSTLTGDHGVEVSNPASGRSQSTKL